MVIALGFRAAFVICWTILANAANAQPNPSAAAMLDLRAGALIRVTEARLSYLHGSTKLDGCSVQRALDVTPAALDQIAPAVRNRLHETMTTCEPTAVRDPSARFQPTVRVDSLRVDPAGSTSSVFLSAREGERYWEEAYTLKAAPVPVAAPERAWVVVDIRLHRFLLLR